MLFSASWFHLNPVVDEHGNTLKIEGAKKRPKPFLI
jgi:hypothetical protein